MKKIYLAAFLCSLSHADPRVAQSSTLAVHMAANL